MAPYIPLCLHADHEGGIITCKQDSRKCDSAWRSKIFLACMQYMDPFYQHGKRGPFTTCMPKNLTLNPAWTSNFIHYQVWDEITSPFPNFMVESLKFGNEEVISPTLYWVCDYLSMLRSKTIHVSERSPGPVFCLLLRVSSDYAQPITGQVTEVTCPVIGRA